MQLKTVTDICSALYQHHFEIVRIDKYKSLNYIYGLSHRLRYSP